MRGWKQTVAMAVMALVVCVGAPTATAKQILCTMSGSAGQLPVCPIHLVRESQNSPIPTAIQLKVKYTQDVTLDTFLDGEITVGDTALT